MTPDQYTLGCCLYVTFCGTSNTYDIQQKYMHNSYPCILEHVVQEKVGFLKFSYSAYITFLWTSYLLEVINKVVWTSYLLEVINKAVWTSYLLEVINKAVWRSYLLEVINKAVWRSYLLEVINKAAVVSLLVGVCGYRRGLEYLVNLQT